MELTTKQKRIMIENLLPNAIRTIDNAIKYLGEEDKLTYFKNKLSSDSTDSNILYECLIELSEYLGGYRYEVRK